MLFALDPAGTAARVAQGDYPCPNPRCPGNLRPWGAARKRPVRLLGGGIDWVTPRRGRCRQCERSHVFLPVRAFPRRTDSVETVWKALIAASDGLGHRKVAEQVGVPATTVRGWLQRARTNSEIITARATILRSDLDVHRVERHPTFDNPLAHMVHMVGAAAGAWRRRFGVAVSSPGSTGTPQQIASVITGGWLLASGVPPSARFWRPG